MKRLLCCLALVACGGESAEPGLPDAPWLPNVSPEVDGRLTINEIMAKNALTIADEDGYPGDWIELYNPTDETIALRGYGLAGGVIQDGVTIEPHGLLLEWVTLAEEGGLITLTRPDGTFIDRVEYGPQTVDFSAAREPDGSDAWAIQWLVTPGAPNAAGAGAPVAVEDASLAPEKVPDVGDLSVRLLADDVLPELGLEIADEHMRALETSPREYVPGYVLFEGRRYGPIGVRLKGQNSFQPIFAKPSLRLNVNKYHPDAGLFGLKDLTLNNLDDDASMLHERIAYWSYRQMGLPASRATHALLTVNGVFYGVYMNVETVKKQMIGRWFDDSGQLFEATDVDFTDPLLASFELEAGADDRSRLAGLADALELPNADEAITLAGAYADLDQFLTYWAMGTVVGQFDAMPYSLPGDDYFIYVDPATGKIVFLPWGMDETFLASRHGMFLINARLATRCLESPACHDAFVQRAWEGLAWMEGADLESMRVRLAEEIAPHAARDLKKPYADTTVAEWQRDMYWFIKERRTRFTEQLPPAH